MIVLDASATIDWLLQTASGLHIERRIFSRSETLHAPHLLDLEVAQAFSRLASAGTISTDRAEDALRDLRSLRIARYPHFIFLNRIWQHRHNLSAYDAAYVVLAEKLGAPLVTRDRRLASASNLSAIVELF